MTLMKTTANTGATVTESQAYEAIRLAQVHEHEGRMPSSAQLAAGDAVKCFNRGDYTSARMRARDSLSYSVGVFHPDYQRA